MTRGSSKRTSLLSKRSWNWPLTKAITSVSRGSSSLTASQSLRIWLLLARVNSVTAISLTPTCSHLRVDLVEAKRSQLQTKPCASRIDKQIVKWSCNPLTWPRLYKSFRAVWIWTKMQSSCSSRTSARYQAKSWLIQLTLASLVCRPSSRLQTWIWHESDSFGLESGRCSASTLLKLVHTRTSTCQFSLSTLSVS